MSSATLAASRPVSRQWSKHADCHPCTLYSSSITGDQVANGCDTRRGRPTIIYMNKDIIVPKWPLQCSGIAGTALSRCTVSLSHYNALDFFIINPTTTVSKIDRRVPWKSNRVQGRPPSACD